MREFLLLGLKCPLPLLRAKLELRGVNQGDTIRIVTDDSSAERDFKRFGEATGHIVRVKKYRLQSPTSVTTVADKKVEPHTPTIEVSITKV